MVQRRQCQKLTVRDCTTLLGPYLRSQQQLKHQQLYSLVLPTVQPTNVTSNSTSDLSSSPISTGNGTDVTSGSSGGPEASPTGNSGATGTTGGAEFAATEETTVAP